MTTGQHTFAYDYVFGDGATDPNSLYPKCVAPLVDGLFKGYNATVFAYGQTGSGKTYTMGSEYKPGGKSVGVIPEAINAIFNRIAVSKDAEVTVRVSFVEIHKVRGSMQHAGPWAGHGRMHDLPCAWLDQA